LKAGLTVDDITTAIQTGWRMSGASSAPTLSFHKETNLLIGAGDMSSLQVIDEVLRTLKPTTGDALPAPADKSAEKKS
jgi:hypothetical protein